MADSGFRVGQHLVSGQGSEELVIPDFGAIPKAISLFYSAASADNSITPDAIFGSGSCDGTSEYSIFTRSLNGASPPSVTRYSSLNGVMVPLRGGTTVDAVLSGVGDGVGTNPGPIANGWRLSKSRSMQNSHLVTFILWGGDDFRGQVFVTEPLTDQDVQIVLPLRSRGFLFSGVADAFEELVAAANVIHLGQASWENGIVQQRMVGLKDFDDNGTVESETAVIQDRIAAQPNQAPGQPPNWAARVKDIVYPDINTTELTIEITEGNAQGDRIAGLAIDLDINQLSVVDFVGPVSDSTDWVVNTGIQQPGGGLLIGTLNTELNEWSTGAQSSGLSVVALAQVERSIATSYQHGAATAVNSSVSSDKALQQLLNDGATLATDAGGAYFDGPNLRIDAANIDLVNAPMTRWIGLFAGLGAENELNLHRTDAFFESENLSLDSQQIVAIDDAESQTETRHLTLTAGLIVEINDAESQTESTHVALATQPPVIPHDVESMTESSHLALLSNQPIGVHDVESMTEAGHLTITHPFTELAACNVMMVMPTNNFIEVQKC